MTKEIPLGGVKAAGRVALVDDEDFDFISRFSWRIYEKFHQNRRRTNGPYARAWVRPPEGGPRKLCLMHKLLTGWAVTDHVNHDGLDNRRSNLREATRILNGANQRPFLGYSSSYKGVCWCKTREKWMAYAGGKQRKRLGTFDDEIQAALAYDKAARELYGEYAYLNFPEEV